MSRSVSYPTNKRTVTYTKAKRTIVESSVQEGIGLMTIGSTFIVS